MHLIGYRLNEDSLTAKMLTNTKSYAIIPTYESEGRAILELLTSLNL